MLPQVFKNWIDQNSAPSYINNSRDIHTKRITFMYKKWRERKNEYWARQLEDYTGISYDYKGIDSVGNN